MGATDWKSVVQSSPLASRAESRVASERLRAVDPSIPCLFMSGYTMSIQDTEFVQDPSRRFIPKPFNAGQLLREVRTALGAAGAPRK